MSTRDTSRPWAVVAWSDLKPGDVVLGLRGVQSVAASVGIVRERGRITWVKPVSTIPPRSFRDMRP